MDNPAVPLTHDVFTKKYEKNTRYSGQGLELKIHMPCPFCAEPDFVNFKLLEMREKMIRPHECQACGRAMKLRYEGNPSQLLITMIQTKGAPPPDFLSHTFVQEREEKPS